MNTQDSTDRPRAPDSPATGVQHTPGPWHTHDTDVHAQYMRDGIYHHHWVANTGNEGSRCLSEAEQVANARLIAAAPELKESNYNLAMLALQSERYAKDPDYRDAVDAALAANAKAEGR